MNKYRIIEETGNLIGKTRFYIEYLGTTFFGKEIWKVKYLYHPEGGRRMVVFDTLIEAEDWVKDRIETVSNKIHNTFTTNK